MKFFEVMDGDGWSLGKKGQIAEGVHMIYRLLMVTLVSFIIFSAGSLSYHYYINVKNVEVRILAREVVDCLSGDGILNLDNIGEKDHSNIISYCGIIHSDRFYLGIEVLDDSGKKIDMLKEGDSGAIWIKDLFGKVDGVSGSIFSGDVVKTVENIIKYDPGYFVLEYPVFFIKDGVRNRGKVKMEVLVNYED